MISITTPLLPHLPAALTESVDDVYTGGAPQSSFTQLTQRNLLVTANSFLPSLPSQQLFLTAPCYCRWSQSQEMFIPTILLRNLEPLLPISATILVLARVS
jgi:hypothetical protein